MIRKTLFGTLLALSLVATTHAGGFGAGFATGMATTIITNAVRPQKTVVVEKTVVVHEHHHSTSKTADAKPAATPVTTPVVTPVATPAPTPAGVGTSASTTATTVKNVVVKQEDPAPIATTEPVKIDEPSDLTESQMALLHDKVAVVAYFEDLFKRTHPTFSLIDSSLFMEVRIGAYTYLVAKITMNGSEGLPIEQGFVIDLKNQFCTTLDLVHYHAFMHTGDVSLLGEKFLNPLD